MYWADKSEGRHFNKGSVQLSDASFSHVLSCSTAARSDIRVPLRIHTPPLAFKPRRGVLGEPHYVIHEAYVAQPISLRHTIHHKSTIHVCTLVILMYVCM